MGGIFIPFHSRFEEIALRETKIITVAFDNSNIPSGKYYLFESYCEDSNCDCRKVMINVIPVYSQKEILATIGYGWESVKFFKTILNDDYKKTIVRHYELWKNFYP